MRVVFFGGDTMVAKPISFWVGLEVDAIKAAICPPRPYPPSGVSYNCIRNIVLLGSAT